MTNIVFLPGEAWDGSKDCVAFPAIMDGNKIRCFVSWESLQDNFGGSAIQPLEAFKASRGAIERKALALILIGRFEIDGSILIRSRDGA